MYLLCSAYRPARLVPNTPCFRRAVSLTTKQMWSRESRERCLGSAGGGRNIMAAEPFQIAAAVVASGVEVEQVRRSSIDNDINVRHAFTRNRSSSCARSKSRYPATASSFWCKVGGSRIVDVKALLRGGPALHRCTPSYRNTSVHRIARYCAG